jgi:NAD(P)H-hydrate repair Nnr-like enzyme with NAD(P)H-hydrate epimerase domain
MAREPTKPQPSRTGKKSVSVYLSPEKRRKVKLLAAATDTTVDALMRRAAELVLAEHKGEPRKRRRGAWAV